MSGTNKGGQAILEYAVITVCVIAALLAMQVYVKRGISGSLRGSADQLGKQYEPGYVTSAITTTTTGDTYTETRTFKGDVDGEDGNEKYSLTFSVSGPESLVYTAVTEGGDEVISIDRSASGAEPETTTTTGTETISAHQGGLFD